MANSKKEASINEDVASDESKPVLGALLTQAREKQKLSIEDAASQLRLSVKQVIALEQDDFAVFASAMLAKGFIKNYARLLSLDSAPLIDAFLLLSPPEVVQSISYQPPSDNAVLLADHSKFWLIMLMVGALIASLVVWLIYANLKPAQDSPSTEISLVEPASESAPSSPTLPEAALPAAERKAEAESVEVSKPATANIKFTFTDSSWVSVQDKDGKTVLSKLAQKGSSEEAFGVPPLKVLIGNAAAATVLFEGKPVDLSGHSNNNVASMTLSAE